MKARWWRKKDKDFQCGLCFRSCLISEGGKGFCGVRGVEKGNFVSPVLGFFCSLAVDPIEKKPFHHWRPGSSILSLGSLGCTMDCPFCQNHSIAHPKVKAPLNEIPPRLLAEKTKKLGQKAVAYTYNEPTLQAEYIIEAAPFLEEIGATAALVTNGLMSAEVTVELAAVSAAANVDLKSFNLEAYARMGGSLERVKSNIALMLERGMHLELTTLVVPGLSDDPEEFVALCDWVASLSRETPLHISRYFPAYKYSAPMTDLSTMKQFQAIAEERLRRVHLGNIR